MFEKRLLTLDLDPGGGDVVDEVALITLTFGRELENICQVVSNICEAEAKCIARHTGNDKKYQSKFALSVSTSDEYLSHRDILIESLYDLIAKICNIESDHERLAEKFICDIEKKCEIGVRPDYRDEIFKSLQAIQAEIRKFPRITVKVYPHWNRTIAASNGTKTEELKEIGIDSEDSQPIPDNSDLFTASKNENNLISIETINGSRLGTGVKTDPNESGLPPHENDPDPINPEPEESIETLDLILQAEYTCRDGHIRMNFHMNGKRLPCTLNKSFVDALISHINSRLDEAISVRADVGCYGDGRVKIISMATEDEDEV